MKIRIILLVLVLGFLGCMQQAPDFSKNITIKAQLSNDVDYDSVVALSMMECEEVYSTADIAFYDEYRFKTRIIFYKDPLSVRGKDNLVDSDEMSDIVHAVDYLNCVMDDAGYSYDLYEILVDTSLNKWARMDLCEAHMSLAKLNPGISKNSMINIHVYPLSKYRAGRALGIPSNHISIQYPFLSTSVLPHEMGHKLGLIHCHRIDTTNGLNPYTGDMVCDIPSGPSMSGMIDKSCNFIGDSSLFPPGSIPTLQNNYMGYSHYTCRHEWTEGQKMRMLWYVTNTPDLYLSLSLSGPRVAPPKISILEPIQT